MVDAENVYHHLEVSTHFGMFQTTLPNVSGSVLATVCSVLYLTNRSEQFRCVVMFENEHAFRS